VKHLYELEWEITTDTHVFCHREFKVFVTEASARRYGHRRERELNGGLTIEQRAQDGWYYKYRGAEQVTEIDGTPVRVEST
jgi:hypothetical protein